MSEAIINKQKAIDKILDDFTESRIDSYWFPHSETQIEWSTHQEVYLILHQDKTYDYAEPKYLDTYVENLKEKDLKLYWEQD